MAYILPVCDVLSSHMMSSLLLPRTLCTSHSFFSALLILARSDTHPIHHASIAFAWLHHAVRLPKFLKRLKHIINRLDSGGVFVMCALHDTQGSFDTCDLHESKQCGQDIELEQRGLLDHIDVRLVHESLLDMGMRQEGEDRQPSEVGFTV